MMQVLHEFGRPSGSRRPSRSRRRPLSLPLEFVTVGFCPGMKGLTLPSRIVPVGEAVFPQAPHVPPVALGDVAVEGLSLLPGVLGKRFFEKSKGWSSGDSFQDPAGSRM